MIKYLEWDSAFFQKKIGKISLSDTTFWLGNMLHKAQEQSYSLIYAFLAENLSVPQNILSAYNGYFIDKKVNYFIEIKGKQSNMDKVNEYSSTVLTHEIEQLAYESGKYSRFRIDKNFNKLDFYNLYLNWIKKSVTKKIADKVFIIEEKNKIVGMVTLKLRDNAEIGLIGVSPSSQGMGYGTALIKQCLYEAKKNNIKQLIVPTQKNNKNACNFYEKCGFNVQSITNIYHFWIK